MTPTHFKTFRLGRTPPHVCVANKPPLGKEPGWEWNKKNHGMHKARSLDELQSNNNLNLKMVGASHDNLPIHNPSKFNPPFNPLLSGVISRSNHGTSGNCDSSNYDKIR
jgi:hypothetical protein